MTAYDVETIIGATVAVLGALGFIAGGIIGSRRRH